jgi:hypothetical protein
MTQDQLELVVGLAAVIVVCGTFVLRALLARYKPDAYTKYEKYYPYAIMAAKWVEKQVPDAYGADLEDSGTAKAAHKLDLFIKKFLENAEKLGGAKPNDAALKAEAMRWSVELANQLNAKKAVAPKKVTKKK